MSWLEAVGGIWLQSIAWLVALSLAFLVLTGFSPCNPGKNWWTDRRAALTDLIYWLVLPFCTQAGRVAFLVLGASLLYGNDPPADFTLRHWPMWAQCVGILLVQDVLLYGIHRLFHTRFGWRFHAVHHSPEVLDWTSTQRFHPVNAVAEFALADAVVLLMGFSPLALAILGPINLIYSVMVHANLNWTFGPLKYVFASPVFHRWHHTSEAEGLDKNFASTFPILDLAFGTFHMPAGKRPENYGAAAVPVGFVGQMIHPFRGIESRPILASTIALVIVGIAVAGWYEFSKPLPELTVVDPGSPSADKPPALLRFTPPDEKRDASAVAISAASSRAVFGTTDGRVSILDLSTSTEVAVEGHSRRVNCAAFSPNGRLAITAGGDGTARVFDTDTGRYLRTLTNHGTTAMSAAIGDDGWAITGTVDGVARVWNAEGLLAKKRGFGAGSIHAVALSSEGAKAIVAQAAGVSLWEPAADKVAPWGGVKNLAYAVAISPTGAHAVAGDYEGELSIWETDGGRPPVAVAGHIGPIYAVAIAGDGTVTSGGADGAVRLWDAKTGAKDRSFEGYAGLMFGVSFAPARNRIAAVGKDGVFRVWHSAPVEVVPAGAIQPVPR